MKEKKLEFLGQCHAPNTVRGYEVTDRKQVWVGDWNYNYSLETDSELAAEHALDLHAKNIEKEVCIDDCDGVRKQLGLGKKAATKAAVKPASKAGKKGK